MTIHRIHSTTILACAVMALSVAGCDQAAPPAPQASASAIADDKVEASLSAIMQYLQSGELTKAEAIARTLVARSPELSRAHEMLGQVQIERAGEAERGGDMAAALNRRKEAWASYRDATRLDPNSAGLQQSAGLVAMAAGESDAALERFLKAEALDRTNPQYPLYAAQLLLQADRLDEAEAALQRTLAVAPDEPYAHASLAMVHLERGRFDAAIAEIQIARVAEPDNLGFRAQHAKVLRRKSQPRDALELLIGLDEASRAQEAATFEIAAAYDALGEPRKAAEAWALCCRANARNASAWKSAVRAGELFLKANDKVAAAQWAGIAEQLNPQAAEVIALAKALRGR